MSVFPLQSLMDEQACYEYLLSVLHPQGSPCPQGHPLPAGHGAQDRQRTPIVDYRGKTCGAVFTLFTHPSGRKTRYIGILFEMERKHTHPPFDFAALRSGRTEVPPDSFIPVRAERRPQGGGEA